MNSGMVIFFAVLVVGAVVTTGMAVISVGEDLIGVVPFETEKPLSAVRDSNDKVSATTRATVANLQLGARLLLR